MVATKELKDLLDIVYLLKDVIAQSGYKNSVDIKVRENGIFDIDNITLIIKMTKNAIK